MPIINYATVAEIIRALKTFPPNEPVFITRSGNKGLYPVESLLLLRLDRKCVLGVSAISWDPPAATASRAIQAWLNAKTTLSIPAVVKSYGGEPKPQVLWRHKFYHFPDGSWICTTGAGRAHRFAIGTGEVYKPELMEKKERRPKP